MTAFAIRFARNSATVGSDTLAYTPDGRPLGFITKVLPMPGQRCVLFARGQQEIVVAAWAALHLAPHLADFADVAAALPDVLQAFAAGYAERNGIEDHTKVGLLEAVLLGYCPAAKRMRLVQYINMRSFIAEDAGEFYGTHSFPRLPDSYMPKQVAGSDRDLVRVIQAAGKYFEENEPVVRIGGEVVATEVRATGLTTRTLHRFPDYMAVRQTARAVVDAMLADPEAERDVVRNHLVAVDDMRDSGTGERLSA